MILKIPGINTGKKMHFVKCRFSIINEFDMGSRRRLDLTLINQGVDCRIVAQF